MSAFDCPSVPYYIGKRTATDKNKPPKRQNGSKGTKGTPKRDTKKKVKNPKGTQTAQKGQRDKSKGTYTLNKGYQYNLLQCIMLSYLLLKVEVFLKKERIKAILSMVYTIN